MPKGEKAKGSKIRDILLKGNYLTEENFKKAEKLSKERRISISDALLAGGLMTKDLLGQAIAESYKLPYADLNSIQPSREQVLMIKEAAAIKYRAVLFSIEPKNVTIATDKPTQKGLLTAMKHIFKGKKVRIAYSLSEDIDNNFIHYRKSLETRFGKILQSQERIAPEIIEEIFEDALIYRASDIHFEPQEKEVVIRFRIDGVLHEAGRVPKEHYENILNRIKVQARLRIDEHFSAQDGAIRYVREEDNQVIDMRVSIVPTLDGEKIAIRLLSRYVRSFTLADLGLSPSDQELFIKASNKPFGMILITGPTGSGKTTTLYALLKILNKPEINITTIEDPVEYKITGLNQIQVKKETNLTFANGLRSIIRQDPDIILVGEIRDTETAEIAVNAALTGHLLFSTFHANDAATSIPRLLDMGIEPFLLSSTLELIVAQRLVRKICENCRYGTTVHRSKIKKDFPGCEVSFSKSKITLYKGKGCNLCSNTGYHGRIAIFEFIQMSRELQDLILQNPSSQQIWQLARKQGSHSLFEDGIKKVKSGVTTLEELFRVAKPESKDTNYVKNKEKKAKA